MSSGKKLCCYKNCDQDPNCTFFKFPIEKDRFYAWVQRAGLSLKGLVSTSESRYLCEKHFIPNYISTQSRRKMLVHTAVPEKYRDDLVLDEGEPTNFTILDETQKQPRKSKFAPRVSDQLIVNTTSIHNQLKRKWNEIAEDIESIEYVNECSSPPPEVVDSNLLYEETTIPAPSREARKYIVVKSRNAKLTQLKFASPKKIINCIEPTRTTKTEEESFFLTEEGDIASSSNISDVKNTQVEVLSNPPPPATLENCTEFIFNGELYVQMPKRVFMAEKERLKAEGENYRKMLVELRAKIDGYLQH